MSSDPMANLTSEAELSKLLFEAREALEMQADMTNSAWLRGMVARLDAYRAERGWSPDGFGGEA